MEKIFFSQLACPPEFTALVAPVEAVARRALTGPGLVACLAAFREDEPGFAACVRRALQKHAARKIRCPLGVLVVMVRDGEHRVPQFAPPAISNGHRQSDAGAESVRPIDDCIGCGRRVPLNLPTLKCDDCEPGEAA